MTRFPKLAGLAEVASLAGVTRKRAWQLTQHKDFPAPVIVLAATPVWRVSDVQAFLDMPRPAGRARIRDTDLEKAEHARQVEARTTNERIRATLREARERPS